MRLGERPVIPLIGAALVCVLLVGGYHWWNRSPETVVTERGWAALPRRVEVEVLNSGMVPGMARVGTVVLRRAGLDVVYLGTAAPADTGHVRTQILVRRGDSTGAGRIVEALGDAEIIDAPDRTRLLDLTVLLGSQFKGSPPR